MGGLLVKSETSPAKQNVAIAAIRGVAGFSGNSAFQVSIGNLGQGRCWNWGAAAANTVGSMAFAPLLNAGKSWGLDPLAVSVAIGIAAGTNVVVGAGVGDLVMDPCKCSDAALWRNN